MGTGSREQGQRSGEHETKSREQGNKKHRTRTREQSLHWEQSHRTETRAQGTDLPPAGPLFLQNYWWGLVVAVELPYKDIDTTL